MAQFQFDGKKLRQLREERGLYLKDVAAAVGCSAAAVGQWETGKRNPSTAAAKKLAEFFDVDSASLWLGLASSGQSDKDIYHPKTQGDVLRLIRALLETGAQFETHLGKPEGLSLHCYPASEQAKLAFVNFGILYNTARYGPGVPNLEGADWQSILDAWMEQTLPTLDKIPLDKEETPAPEE